MASNIIIGSLIACKLLVSPSLETKVEEKQESVQESVQKNGSGTNIMLGNITKKLQEEARKSQSNSISEVEEINEEKIIIGTVLNIEEKEYWKKNKETNKFFKAKKKTLKVKSDNFVDVLYISEDACGLYDDIVESQETTNKKEDVKIEVSDSKEKVIVKKSVKNKLNKNEYEEEYIIVPLDYDLKNKDNMEEIKDTDTKKKINKALNSYFKKNNYNIRTDEERIAIQKKIKEQEDFYKKIAEKQKNIFSEPQNEVEKKNIQKEDSIIIDNVNEDKTLADNKKELDKKDESFFGMNIVAKFEEDVKKEQKRKEEKNIEIVDNKITTKDKTKENKIETKKENRNDFSKGALISRAFKIILKEW